VAWAAWAFTRPEHGIWYELSIASVVLWLARYALLIGRGGGQAPEALILRDRVLLALSITWRSIPVRRLRRPVSDRCDKA